MGGVAFYWNAQYFVCMQVREILIVEDEFGIAEAVTFALRREGFAVTHNNRLDQAMTSLSQKDFDLILLDIGLPDGDGRELCKWLRAQQKDTPVFFLTARHHELDRLSGFEIGADDYIPKPFSVMELVAKVKAFFRRIFKETSANLQYGPFELDESKHTIKWNDNVLSLTKYEYGIFATFIKNPGKVYSRSDLMYAVWAEPSMSMERTVDTHIKVLRTKIKQIDPEKDWIVTHRGFGYSLRELAAAGTYELST